MASFHDLAAPLSLWERGHLTYLFFEQHGRLSCWGYMAGTVLLLFFSALAMGLFAMIGVFMDAADFPLFRDVCFFIPLFVFVYGFIALTVKRLHDLGFSGWWALGGLIPLVGTISLFLIVFFIPGMREVNQYGPPAA